MILSFTKLQFVQKDYVKKMYNVFISIHYIFSDSFRMALPLFICYPWVVFSSVDLSRMQNYLSYQRV